MFILLSEQATGNPHGPYGRPGSRGTMFMLVTPGIGLVCYEQV